MVYPSLNFQVGIPARSVSGGQGAPLVIMEAFSRRTPVVASNLGSVPTLLEQTGGGLVYGSEQELLDALDRLVTDPDERERLAQRGHEAYRELWAADTHLEQYLGLIDELAGTPAAPATIGAH